MAVETTEKFICDGGDCTKSTASRAEFTEISVTYRLADGSSGTETKHYCPDDSNKVMKALRRAGVITNEPVAPPPPLEAEPGAVEAAKEK